MYCFILLIKLRKHTMNQITIDNIEKQFSWFSRCIIWCTCVDQDILKTCSRAIIMKYMTLGGLILVPALFAFPSAAIFIKMAFFPTNPNGIYLSLAFGLVWSWIILSFDS